MFSRATDEALETGEREFVMARYVPVLILALTCLAAGGCGSVYYKLTGIAPPREVVVTVREPQAMLNFTKGREYAARGRYELAREQYLHAYAASEGDSILRSAAAREVQAMDLLIKGER
jgi:hypothetical protein